MKQTALFVQLNLFLIGSLLFATASFAKDAEDSESSKEYDGSNRFGAMISQSNDGTQVGFVNAAKHYEINFTVDGLFEGAGFASTPNGSTYNIGITGRVGWRVSLGDYNFLSLGLEGHRGIIQQTNGFARDPQVFFGPYIGMQRQFPHSNFMLLGWICPWARFTSTAVDGSGNKQTDIQNQFFEVGGIGFAYLL